MMDRVEFRDVMPYYENVSVGDYGYFWLTDNPDYTAEGVMETPLRLWVLSPEGEYLGDTRYPLMYGRVSRGYLCARQANEETGEIDYIIYRIESAVPGFVYP